jgi:hypothetical protein
MFQMNVSSIPASVPVKPPEANEPKPPQVKTDTDADTDAGASRTAQPAVLAPLPPGQGTRVNQLA